MIYHADWIPKKAIKEIDEYLAWKNNPVHHTLTAKAAKMLQSGFLFTCGRD